MVSSKNYSHYNLTNEEQIIWSLDEAYSYSETLNSDKIFIAGGAKLYNSTFDVVDEIWITQVEKEYPEADTFYYIPEGFEMADEVCGDECEYAGLEYSFQKWSRFD